MWDILYENEYEIKETFFTRLEEYAEEDYLEAKDIILILYIKRKVGFYGLYL